jgi:hypothetical protein
LAAGSQAGLARPQSVSVSRDLARSNMGKVYRPTRPAPPRRRAPTPRPFDLDELCRVAAREMLALALDAERRAYLAAHAGTLDATGHRLVVGNGYARERPITTGARRVEVARRGSTTGERASASARRSCRPMRAAARR